MCLEDVEIRTVGDLVRLVQDQQCRVAFKAELGKHGLDRLDLAFGFRAGGIDNVEQQFGLTRLLESSLERGDQSVGQIANEADCVGQ